MATQNYVAGFLFRDNQTQVALVCKQKPAWQHGKLNAIGGKVEPGETEYAAMVREFKEEAGMEITDWTPVAILSCGDATIHFFRSFAGNSVELPSVSDTGESLWWVGAERFCESVFPCIPNLKWLVPMAADSDQPFGEIKSGFSGK